MRIMMLRRAAIIAAMPALFTRHAVLRARFDPRAALRRRLFIYYAR